MTITTIEFENFEKPSYGRLITTSLRWKEEPFGVVFSKNPYGSHNLIIVNYYNDSWHAMRHGNETCVSLLHEFFTKKSIRKVLTFLANKGIRFDSKKV